MNSTLTGSERVCVMRDPVAVPPAIELHASSVQVADESAKRTGRLKVAQESLLGKESEE